MLFCLLVSIEHHCDSATDASRCVLALPAAASIATGAFTVSGRGQSHLTTEQTAKPRRKTKQADLL